jgi:hypothetical protein
MRITCSRVCPPAVQLRQLSAASGLGNGTGGFVNLCDASVNITALAPPQRTAAGSAVSPRGQQPQDPIAALSRASELLSQVLSDAGVVLGAATDVGYTNLLEPAFSGRWASNNMLCAVYSGCQRLFQ